MRPIHLVRSLVVLLGLTAAFCPARAQTLKANPASYTFTYTLGSATLPTSQTMQVSVVSGNPVNFAVTSSGGSWLTVTPDTGKTAATLKVNVNPTSLAIGTYPGTVTLSPAGGGAPTTAAVTLLVQAPPASLSASPTALAFTYVRGSTLPAAMNVQLSGNGALMPYAIAISGATWLSATPMSGIIFPAFTAIVAFTADPTGLAPGVYKSTVTVSSTSAANKSVTLAVTFTITPGLPTVTSVFPAGVVSGSPASTVTLIGTNFYSGSAVAAGVTPLASTVLGTTTMQVSLPASMLGAAGTLNLTVSNPNPGGGTSNILTFTVYAPGPRINGITNAASFVSGSVVPGEMVTIFGTGMGPDPLVPFTPPTGGAPIDTTIGGVTVNFDTAPAPLIYVSSTQITAMVPFSVSTATVNVTVTYGAQTSAAFVANVGTSVPGLFTMTSNGSGQAAAFNLNETTSELTLNSDSVTASKGGVVLLFGTGLGTTTPAGADGNIATAATPYTVPTVTVKAGGQDATVLYIGPAPGLVDGMFQLNIRLATNTPTGRAVNVIVTANGVDSPAGVTLGVK